ncbi:hypothetical protein PROPEN_02974 [Proteus penneri ATCC 35198]|nr:hypothetical protein PROPEN_02974 [Proteus penneri ATCC 35198]
MILFQITLIFTHVFANIWSMVLLKMKNKRLSSAKLKRISSSFCIDKD